jgi:hypothetical protein
MDSLKSNADDIALQPPSPAAGWWLASLLLGGLLAASIIAFGSLGINLPEADVLMAMTGG